MSVIADNEYKEVDFKTYCQKCKHKDLDDARDPCNECLENISNLGSSKPVRFAED
jgi:hypothetical protein